MKRLSGFLALMLAVLLPAAGIRAQNSLPSGVYPDSRSRLPMAKAEGGNEQAQNPAAGFGANASGIQTMGAAVRRAGYRGGVVQSDSPLGLPFMQLVILATAREHDQPFEWSLHEMQAVAVGLDPKVIDVVRNRKPLKGLPENDAIAIQMAREIFGKHELPEATYAKALKVFGQKNLVDIIGLMADYASTSVSLSAFNQQMPPGWRQFLPLPFTPPDDIHPDSRSRLPLITDRVPGDPAFAKPLYGRNPTPVGTGPAYIGMHGGNFASMEASVGRPIVDLAILVTARENDSEYDWTMNEIQAMKDGLDAMVIDVVRDRKSTAGLPENDAALIDFGRELLHAHNVSAETYARALKAFGEKNMVGLAGVMGAHTREAALLTAFDQRLPVGQKPLLPLP